MIVSDLFARGRAVVASRWAPAFVVALIALVLVHYLNAARSVGLERARVAEAEVLRASGVAVAAQKDAAGVRADLAAAEESMAGFREEIDRLKKAAPGARPVIVIRASTGAVVADGTPRPDPEPVGSTSCPVCRPCLLAAGDRAELRLAEALFDTKAGNVVFRGVGEGWRLWPEPETRLFGGRIEAETTIERPDPPPGWGLGAIGWAGRDGWAAGPAVAPPPLRLSRLELSAALGAALGSGGTWGIGGTAIGRWR